jgi:hypothetical protein
VPSITNRFSLRSPDSGYIVLRHAKADFAYLEFKVPWASLLLNGFYGLQNEDLDFHGKLRMVAKVSQTTTGLKSFLLRAFNPFFKYGAGGSVLPVKVTGLPFESGVWLELRGRAKPGQLKQQSRIRSLGEVSTSARLVRSAPGPP